MRGENILGGVISLGRVPVAGNGSNEINILGSFKYSGSTCGTTLGLTGAGNTLQNGDFATIRQAGDHIIGNNLALIAELNGNLAVKVSAGFRQSSGINAGSQIDDLDALFVALHNAGDKVGAIDGRNDDNIVIHISHGHQNIKLALSVALGGAGLDIDGNAQLFGGCFVAVLHICPELIGHGDDDGADLFSVGSGGLAQLLRHCGIEGCVQLVYHSGIHSGIGRGVGIGGRLRIIAAGDQCQQHHCRQQQSY